jgi:hypothetical protein
MQNTQMLASTLSPRLRYTLQQSPLFNSKRSSVQIGSNRICSYLAQQVLDGYAHCIGRQTAAQVLRFLEVVNSCLDILNWTKTQGSPCLKRGRPVVKGRTVGNKLARMVRGLWRSFIFSHLLAFWWLAFKFDCIRSEDNSIGNLLEIGCLWGKEGLELAL